MTLKKVFICGLTASGKGLLRPLLDGHPDLVTCPFQGLSLGVFSDAFEEQIIRRQSRSLADMTMFQHSKTKTLTIRLEDNHWHIRRAELLYLLIMHGAGFRELIDGCMNGAIRAGRSQGEQIFVEFECDWIELLRQIESRIVSAGPVLTLETISNVVFLALLSEWKNLVGNGVQNRQIVVTAPNRLSTIKAISRKCTDCKIIVMQRDVTGRCFSNANHIANKGQLGSERKEAGDWLSKGLWSDFNPNLFHQGFIKENRVFDVETTKLSLLNGNIHIVKFEDLFSARQQTMDEVAEFLGIQKVPVLYRASLNRREIESQIEGGFSTRISDDPSKGLTKKQQEFIRYLYDPETRSGGFSERCMFGILDTAIGRRVAQGISGVKKRLTK
jgi:hypothetical protein